MDIEEVYKKLSMQQINNYGDLVKVRSGMFTEEDLINVINGGNELYLRIDKQNWIISKSQTTSQGYLHYYRYPLAWFFI